MKGTVGTSISLRSISVDKNRQEANIGLGTQRRVERTMFAVVAALHPALRTLLLQSLLYLATDIGCCEGGKMHATSRVVLPGCLDQAYAALADKVVKRQSSSYILTGCGDDKGHVLLY